MMQWIPKKDGFFTAHPNNEKKHFNTGFKRCLAGDKDPQARIHEVKTQMSRYKNSIIVGKTKPLEFSGVVFEQKERGYLPTSFCSDLYSFLWCGSIIMPPFSITFFEIFSKDTFYSPSTFLPPHNK